MRTLLIGALGVVYGDIGTSPIYALRECLAHQPGLPILEATMGYLSLIFWALILVVSVKYVAFIMRADNHGEGGIFALLALRRGPLGSRMSGGAIIIILAGAALLYGDGILTPAISVLSAAEGLRTLDVRLTPFILPITCLILILLFSLQRHGSGRIGRYFGPVMLLWFATLAGLGIWHLSQHWQVLAAINPWYAWQLLSHHPQAIFTTLGSVVLAVTGAEALYADMGHFGRKPLALGWHSVVLPALFLNYFGQGAMVLSNPSLVSDPFYSMAEGPLRWGLVLLAFAATIIASQALISGTFSLTQQAIQLGYFPRVRIVHTNAQHYGQIYVPSVNWLLAAGCLAVVLYFGSSDRLASAYGIAVTGSMVATTYAFLGVARHRWHWTMPQALGLCGAFALIDLVFFFSNLAKVAEGGYFPLGLGLIILLAMHTWKIGRASIASRLAKQAVEPEIVVADLAAKQILRVPGCAIFMAASPNSTPVVLLHHLKTNRSLHRLAIMMSLVTRDTPLVKEEDRLQSTELGEGLWRVTAYCGYMERPDVPAYLALFSDRSGLAINPQQIAYYFNRESIVLNGSSSLSAWQRVLYRFLAQNAHAARDYFNIPAGQIVELGLMVAL
jgi:KUP system potassium uptake protein